MSDPFQYNVLVNDDHIIVMMKVKVSWKELAVEERMDLHRVVEGKVKEIVEAVPERAR